MKNKSKNNSWVAVIGCAFFMVVCGQANALTILNFADTHELGFVFAGIPAGDSDVTGYVNQLIGMSPNATTTISGNSFTRSSYSFSPLNTAALVQPRGTYSYNDSQTDPTTLILNLSAGYEYLLAKYDGPNSGTEVWYIGDLTGSVSIPTFNGDYGLSGTSFFTAAVNVPDHGTTILLLGLGLVALGFQRRAGLPTLD